ncbi:Protein kinase-like domain [Phytophthora cactorum]|nr:Protein kinase-like domain [Phytophthora cactorum]
MKLRLRLQPSRVETAPNNADGPLNGFARTESTDAKELHHQLMAIQIRIQAMEELDAVEIRNQFGDTAARQVFNFPSRSYQVNETRATSDRRRNKSFNCAARCIRVNPVLEMDGSLQDKESVPVLESPQGEYYTDYPDDTTSENNASDLELPKLEKQRAESICSFQIKDEIIIKNRIPRDQVLVQEFVSRGGFGKVYKGTYNGQAVAIKTMSDVETFVKEIKMMAWLRHPNIVQFIGVAWNSREDFCCVMEYMDGGDLRALLNKYTELNRPTGFDFSKIMIAFQVARALAYLHSSKVRVLHRDLKSKNILLNQTLDAKLTDFGVSREQIVGPMTAEVGTSLWMAPEVMTGKQYDEKADIFSFGVVLSELSMHTLPYSHVKVRPGANHQLTILRRVAMGELSVKFPDTGPQSMAKLGLACVSMDPRKRPRAVEALRTVHDALMQKAKALV